MGRAANPPFYWVGGWVANAVYSFCWVIWHNRGSAKANGREPKSCLGQFFNFKLGCFCYKGNCIAETSGLTSRVENAAKVSFSWLKIVQDITRDVLLKGKYQYGCPPLLTNLNQFIFMLKISFKLLQNMLP